MIEVLKKTSEKTVLKKTDRPNKTTDGVVTLFFCYKADPDKYNLPSNINNTVDFYINSFKNSHNYFKIDGEIKVFERTAKNKKRNKKMYVYEKNGKIYGWDINFFEFFASDPENDFYICEDPNSATLIQKNGVFTSVLMPIGNINIILTVDEYKKLPTVSEVKQSKKEARETEKSVFEFINLFVEEDKQMFTVYDTEKGKNLFEGFLDDLPPEIADREITSIDNIENSLTLNVKQKGKRKMYVKIDKEQALEMLVNRVETQKGLI